MLLRRSLLQCKISVVCVIHWTRKVEGFYLTNSVAIHLLVHFFGGCTRFNGLNKLAWNEYFFHLCIG